MTWYRCLASGGIELTVQAQPGARKAAIEPYGVDAIKVKVTAKALDGAANAAIVECVAEKLGVAAAQVTIVAGARSRRKRLRVEAPGLQPARLLDADCGGISSV